MVFTCGHVLEDADLVVSFFYIDVGTGYVVDVDQCREVREVFFDLVYLGLPRFSSLQPFGGLVLCYFLS